MKADPYGAWGSPYCEKCTAMTDWYFKENPEKRGYLLCESCYEKSKEFIVYLHKPKENEVIHL